MLYFAILFKKKSVKKCGHHSEIDLEFEKCCEFSQKPLNTFKDTINSDNFYNFRC